MKPAAKQVKHIVYRKYRGIIEEAMIISYSYESIPQLFNIVGDVFDNVLNEVENFDRADTSIMKLLNIVVNPLV